MRIHPPLATLPLVALLVVSAWSPSAQAGVCAFGYTGSTVANSYDIANNVGATAAYVVAPGNNPAYNLAPEVSQIVANTGPVFINLKEVIFNPNTLAVSSCTHYERGPSSTSKAFFAIRGDYQSRLDTWFAANDSLFDYNWNGGVRQVYGLVIHDEANNACVENWKLHLAADYVRQKLVSAAYFPIYVAAGYGLRNIPGGAVSYGLPVTPTGAIDKFPAPLDLIGYSAYDIFNPSNNTDPMNLNAETWSTISGKLNQALRSNQKTAGVLRAYCQTNGFEEGVWGIQCPPNWTNWWKLGILSNNWTNYWKNDSRNLFVIAFHWPDAGSLKGTSSLFTLWNYHSHITPNCSIPFGHDK